MPPRIFLKPKKDRPVRARHPWIFSGAIARVEGTTDGGEVDIHAAGGELLGKGYYNASSQIAARVWTIEDQPINRAFFAQRLREAIQVRARVGLIFKEEQSPTTAFRLVNAEADLLPGLIVDAYGPYLVLQLLTAGVDRLRELFVELLQELLEPTGILERSDVDVRKKEGLKKTKGVLQGQEPPPVVEIQENHLTFGVKLLEGQKSGFYLDQRANRERVGWLLNEAARAPGAAGPFSVLNAFSYTGAFGIYACRAHTGAQVVNLDSSAGALELCRENFARNGFMGRDEPLVGDAFSLLRALREEDRKFNMIILDPPKLAHSRAQIIRACRGYKDLNRLALLLLKPGGTLITFSCSGIISAALFQKVVFDAAHDAGLYCRVLAKLGHGPDHPLMLSFPEGEYLKGLVAQV